MARLDTIVARLAAVDRETRLQTLLEYSRKLPDLPDRLHAARDAGTGRVHECQTPVFLFVEVAGGRVEVHADAPRESPTVRGFLALLVRTLSGAAPAEVAAVPDDLLERSRLAGDLGLTRTQGLTAILQRVKRAAAAA
ncbi:MAG TPA: SufE family protein [Gemmatimonadales bacterium]|nr:SufE family protein [Gemmatimonadales bacterium]